jgi:hypothetical protein
MNKAGKINWESIIHVMNCAMDVIGLFMVKGRNKLAPADGDKSRVDCTACTEWHGGLIYYTRFFVDIN